LWSKKNSIVILIEKKFKSYHGVLFMLRQKLVSSLTLATLVLVALAAPVLGVQYNPGVAVGQYVKYGNFVGSGIGYENFNDYGFLTLQVVGVSGSSVTLLSTGQYKNGTVLPGNGTTDMWDLVSGTKNGVPTTQGYIIATNLNQGDAIPPPNTYTINQTVDRTYLGTTRTVNILEVTVSSPDYNSTLNYVYDKLSGMLLESTSTTTTQAQPQPITSTYSYSIIGTNIFGSTTPSPTIPEFNSQAIALLATLVSIITISIVVIFRKRIRAQPIR
jgi:hypothetical protein